MKVAIFSDSLPPQTDGVSRTYVNLAKTFLEENIEFRFISPFKPGKEYQWHKNVNRTASIPLLLYPEYKISLPNQSQLIKLLSEFQPDLIHVSSPTLLGLSGLSLANQFQIPAVAAYHTHFADYFKYYGYAFIEKWGWNFVRWFYNQFVKVFVPSQTTINELHKLEFNNLELWQRGVDLDTFSPANRKLSLRHKWAPNGETLLLFTGRLVKEKDIHDVINVNKMLLKSRLKFRQVFVGDGPMKNEIKSALPGVVFTGYLYGKELAEAYASCDIFFFPSTTETFGNVVLEASASGLPAVISNKGGIVDLVQHGKTGFIAQANNKIEFVNYLVELVTQRELYSAMQKEAWKSAVHFKWKSINNKLILSYQETIENYYRQKKYRGVA
ncbi:MAG: glycosyltransferase family 1 protein [Calditrichaceae bacterium]|nr:glycosyltransferase family 1 protein [Calditrichaceae bacterium]MBN2708925.1 glycosyltransferase family 1 protein [Calditrichaceae bacterium]RQV97551.1 MAG: glycosyltransferase family 1 protein [Calditrichota bacterium]